MQVKAAPERAPRLVVLAVIVIAVVAAAVRLWNVGAGIPHNIGADEPTLMENVERMMKTGDFNPHFFDWPTLAFYLNLIVSVFVFLAGAMDGAWTNLDQISADNLYLAGRQFTALLGAATVVLTFAAGRRWGLGAGLFAAAFMAIMPGHIRESRLVLTDVPAAFFVTLAWVLALRAVEAGTTRAVAWSGLAVGLAASCKYNGLMAIVFPCLAVFQIGGGWRLIGTRLGLVFTLTVAGFLAGTPYALLDLPAFLNDYARVAVTFGRARSPEPGWSIYLKHFTYGVGWPAAIGVAVGLIAVAIRCVRRPSERVFNLMLLSFVAVYFWVMASKGQIYARYLLPLFPPASVAAAIGVSTLVGWVRARWPDTRATAIAGAVLTIAILGGPALKVGEYFESMAVRSTIATSYDWIVQNIPAGSKFAVEHGVMRLPNKYQSIRLRLLSERSAEFYRNEGVNYLLSSEPDFQAFLTNPTSNPDLADRNRDLVAAAHEIASFPPSAEMVGPHIRVYRLDW